MTLKHLQIFAAVCRFESITRAAEALNMTQPAVSIMIRELESFYEVKLFERMNRRLYITAAGERLRLYAASILEQFDEARATLKDINAVNKIRLGTNASYGVRSLPALLKGFAEHHPHIPVYTMVNNSRRIEKLLLNNELDFGIFDKPHHTELLNSDFLAEDPMVAVCAADGEIPGAISLMDLETIPILTREEGSGFRHVLDYLETHYQIKPNVRVESISTQCLIALCLDRWGLLFLPRTLAQPYLVQGEMKEIMIKDFAYSRTYYLIYHKSKYLTKSMKLFKTYIMST